MYKMVFRSNNGIKIHSYETEDDGLEGETIGGRDTYLSLDVSTIRSESFITTKLVSSQSTSDLNREGKQAISYNRFYDGLK